MGEAQLAPPLSQLRDSSDPDLWHRAFQGGFKVLVGDRRATISGGFTYSDIVRCIAVVLGSFQS